DMRSWVTGESDWTEGIDSAFDGRALNVDADCDEFSDGKATVNIKIPKNAETGKHKLDIFFDTGKDAVYRMSGITVRVTERNKLPNSPSSPQPMNKALVDTTSPALSWSSSDPNEDSLTYDVRLEKGDTSPESVIASDVPDSTLSVSELKPGTTYYWQVTAFDEHGAKIEGPVWQFTTPTSNLPVVNATANAMEVRSGSNTILFANLSTDSIKSGISYSWSQIGGPDIKIQNENSKQVSFTAPDVETQRVISFEVTITNSQGLSDSDEVHITVSPPNQNSRPIAEASIRWKDGKVVLRGLNSTDPDGDELTYDWKQLSGSDIIFQDSKQVASFAVPDLQHPQRFVFNLTVTDESGKSDSDIAAVTILPSTTEDKPEDPPTAEA
ncbi:MAG: fibronectin type III domain-containing protein, partial [Halobacteriaceae archaeon]